MAGLGRLALAALGILAYQNREKLAEILRGIRIPGDSNSSAPGGGGSVFDKVVGGGLGGGLADLIDRFRNAGNGDVVDSWVKQGPTKPITPTDVEQVIDNDTLEALIRQTGMAREEILNRLATNLPKAVDEASPDGELPTDDEPTLLNPVPKEQQSVWKTVPTHCLIKPGPQRGVNLQPHTALAIDMGVAMGYPRARPEDHGRLDLGKGPGISQGPSTNPIVFDLLKAAADEHGIPYQLQAYGDKSPTDARLIQTNRGGVATGLLSVPLRYMHTPSEVLCMDDVEATIRLVCAYCRRVRPDIDFTPW